MQEVEATCTRLIIINRGELAADGTVADLLSAGQGLVQYTVEAEGEGIADALSRLPGVDSHTSEDVEGRTRVQLAVAGNTELRPDIFRLANQQQWVLWELHRGQASLEQLFRELTADADAEEVSANAERIENGDDVPEPVAAAESAPDIEDGGSDEVTS